MRRRILLLTLGTTLLVVLAAVVPLALTVRRDAVSRVEATVQDQARFVGFLAGRSADDPATLASALAAADARGGTRSMVVFPDGSTVGSLPDGVRAQVGSRGAPPPPPTGSPGGTPSGGSGPGADPGPAGSPGDLVDVTGGEVAVAADARFGATALVFVSDATLTAGTTTRYLLLAAGGLALLLLSAAASVVVSRRISAPLTATAAAAHELSLGNTAARAPTAGPREVAEVGTALNRLADRIGELVEEERETVADLSHRLRTPLTALRLDADTLADPTEADRIGEHVATLERTLTAVIRAARRAEREGLVPACDATEVVRSRAEFWTPLAEDQGRRFDRQLPAGPLPVRAASADLAAAVDALVENVLAHTPEGVDFRLSLTSVQDGADLVVTDGGPGIPVGAGVRGRSDRGSTGLGLSIAAGCAENSGGWFALETPPGGGGQVRLHLGRP